MMVNTALPRKHLTPHHNSAGWLRVGTEAGISGKGRVGYLSPVAPGWYVIRTCPCHQGCAVTVPYRSRAEAERAMRVILGYNP